MYNEYTMNTKEFGPIRVVPISENEIHVDANSDGRFITVGKTNYNVSFHLRFDWGKGTSEVLHTPWIRRHRWQDMNKAPAPTHVKKIMDVLKADAYLWACANGETFRVAGSDKKARETKSLQSEIKDLQKQLSAKKSELYKLLHS